MISAPFVTSDMSKLPPEDVAYHLQRFKRAKQADDVDRQRGLRNMQAYMSLDNGQWSDQMVAELKRQGRDPKTFNFLQFLVRGHAGNYVMNSVDPRFIDREDDSIDTTEALTALQAAWYSNKERGNYKISLMQCIENGLVYRGVEELVIHRPSNDPKTWLIKFISISPKLVIFDPCNTNDRLSRTSREAWKMSFLTSKQLLRYFPQAENEIMNAVKFRLDRDESEFEEQDLGKFRRMDLERLGNRELVIEYMHMEDEKVIHDIHISGKVLPVSKHPIGSEADTAFKIDWAARQGMELRDEDITTVVDWEPTLKLTTFCPRLGITLQDKKDERQTGHLPLYAWSFIQKEGKSIGLIDFLFDAQEDLNKRNMAITKILTQTPIAGKSWVSEDVADGTNGTTINDVVNDLNDSSKPLVVPSGLPGDRMFGISQGMSLPNGLLQDETIKIDFLNKIASLPPAMQGFSERSGESGLHLGRKVLEGTIMQRVPQEWVLQHEHDKAEDWVVIAKKLYSGPHNYNRTFSSAGGTNKVVANRLVGFDENGSDIVKADIGSLDRVDILIIETKENDYLKQARRELDVAALQAMPPTQTNDMVRAAFETSLAMNQDFVDDEEREKARKACDLRYELAMEQAEVQLLQIKQQKQALTQPPAPPPGMPGMAPGAPGAGSGAPGWEAPMLGPAPEQPPSELAPGEMPEGAPGA